MKLALPWTVVAVCVVLTWPASAAATPSWGPPQRVADEGEAISLAVGPGGRATLFFHRALGCCWQLFGSTRPADGSFRAPERISNPSEDSRLLDLVVDARGRVTALLARGYRQLEARSGPAGGALGPAQPLGQGSSGVNPTGSGAALATAGDGDLFAVWTTGTKVMTARGKDGTFSEPETLVDGYSAGQVGAALGARGDALAAWSNSPFPAATMPSEVQVAFAPAGKGFGTPELLYSSAIRSPFAELFFGFEGIIDGQGGATLAWHSTIASQHPSAGPLYGAIKPAGRPMGSAFTIGPAPDGGELALDGAERTVALWNEHDGSYAAPPPKHRLFYAERRPADTGLSPPVLLERGGYVPSLASDAGAAAWARGGEVRALLGPPRPRPCVDTVGVVDERARIARTAVGSAGGSSAVAAWSSTSDSQGGIFAAIAEATGSPRPLLRPRREKGVLRVRLAAAAHVSVRLARMHKGRWRAVGGLTRALPAGRSLLPIGRWLRKRGRYRAMISAKQCGARASTPRVLRFRIHRAP